MGVIFLRGRTGEKTLACRPKIWYTFYTTAKGAPTNIAINIDDTLTDSYAYFQPFIAEFFGAPVEDVRARGISYGNLPSEWKTREPAFCRAYYDRVVEQTPFKKNAAAAVRALQDDGHTIVIITGRDATMYTNPYKTTQNELKNGGIVYDKLICTCDKTSTCKAEHIHLLIDDVPANIRAIATVGTAAFLFSARGTARSACPTSVTSAHGQTPLPRYGILSDVNPLVRKFTSYS